MTIGRSFTPVLSPDKKSVEVRRRGEGYNNNDCYSLNSKPGAMCQYPAGRTIGWLTIPGSIVANICNLYFK